MNYLLGQMESVEPEVMSQQAERKVGPFKYKLVLTDEWLGDAFYTEDIMGPTREPRGVIPAEFLN